VAVRLADLLAGLSRVADLGFGLPVGSALRSCALATRMAHSLDLPLSDVRAVYYTAFLHHVGCVGYAYETARLFNDEIVANRAAGRTDVGSPMDFFTTFLPTLTRGRPPLERARLAFAALTMGSRWGERFTTTACELGRDTAHRLQLPAEVQLSLFHVYDMWRGRNRPEGRGGGDIPIGSRTARLVGIAVLFDSIGGPDLAIEAVRRRSGGMLDPSLGAYLVDHALQWLADLAARDPRDVVLELEPEPHVMVSDLRVVGEVFGDLADLESPYYVGHSRGVAALAVGAAEHMRLPEATRADLELAGLLHDVGRVAISAAVWDKAGRFSTDEWEQVRLHPYQSERIVAGSSELARLASLIGRHHERLDGSGYHRGSSKEDLSTADRVLAAADMYRTLIEPRPHRAALEPEQVRRRLLEEAGRSTLDVDAVRAVLTAAGHAIRTAPRRLPMGLSEREVQVLGLIARGCSNADIASRLVISRRTAEHHVQHIYTKIGVSGRAAATLFAVEHGLVGGG